MLGCTLASFASISLGARSSWYRCRLYTRTHAFVPFIRRNSGGTKLGFISVASYFRRVNLAATGVCPREAILGTKARRVSPQSILKRFLAWHFIREIGFRGLRARRVVKIGPRDTSLGSRS
ncbi:uncharacterized protein CC84DRAFT_765084 [Paraphaeosphaeria sporulosa]|uniref:Uncharacterized protein n=1 Tax=Paraphaeosphaeria sporulosa TaxID=1460663 RepID=A0A177CFS1_9PLEO|nr:uncharacterized protein CC84DRAFT_765084 [Paraphaeosphaeria sporulosa]OAG06455.1 hypothetical protein CC84DRAFT_765084 [Paraphaeosphaeria sporulosa]